MDIDFVVLWVDGNDPEWQKEKAKYQGKSLNDSIKIKICKAPYTIGIVRQKQHSFFDTLRNKLLWGADRR